MKQVALKRVILKLSGESFLGRHSMGIDIDTLFSLAGRIKALLKSHPIQLAIVVGAGNYLRGKDFADQTTVDRLTADQMGMIATQLNGLALRDSLRARGLFSEVVSPIPIDGMVERYFVRSVDAMLSNQQVVILSGGTGNPFVTTDSAASLRAIELRADCLLKATTVDGIYDKDPRQFNDAKFLHELPYDYALDNRLEVMDVAAFSQCRQFGIPIRVFNFHKEGALERALKGEQEGTLVF